MARKIDLELPDLERVEPRLLTALNDRLRRIAGELGGSGDGGGGATEPTTGLAPGDIPSVTNLSAFEEPFTAVDGRVISRITVAWTPPAGSTVFAGVEIWTRIDPAPWKFTAEFEQPGSTFLVETELKDPPDTLRIQARSKSTSGRTNSSGPETSVLLDLTPADAVAAPNVSNVTVTLEEPRRIIRSRSGGSAAAMLIQWTLPTADPSFTQLAAVALELRRVSNGETTPLITLPVFHVEQRPVSFRTSLPVPDPGGQFVAAVVALDKNGVAAANSPTSAQFFLGEPVAPPAVTNFQAVFTPATIGNESQFFIDSSWTLPPPGPTADAIRHIAIIQEKPVGAPEQVLAIEGEGSTGIRSGPFSRPAAALTARIKARTVMFDGTTNSGSEPFVDVAISAQDAPVPLGPADLQVFVTGKAATDPTDIAKWGLRFEVPPQSSPDLDHIQVTAREFLDNFFPASQRSTISAAAGWSLFNVTTFLDVGTSPVLGQMMDEVRETTANGEHLFQRNLFGLSDNRNLVFSVAVAPRNGVRHAAIRYQNKAGVFFGATINMTTGAVGGFTGAPAEAWANTPAGWPPGVRLLTMVVNTGAGAVQERVVVNLLQDTDPAVFSYTGDGNSSLLFWNMFGSDQEPKQKRFATMGPTQTVQETDLWPFSSDGILQIVRARLVNKFGAEDPASPETPVVIVPETIGLNLGKAQAGTFEALEVVGNKLRPKVNTTTFQISGDQVTIRTNGLTDSMIATLSGNKILAATTIIGVNFQQVALPNTMEITGSGLTQANQSSGNKVTISDGTVFIENPVGSFRTDNFPALSRYFQLGLFRDVTVSNTGAFFTNSSGNEVVRVRNDSAFGAVNLRDTNGVTSFAMRGTAANQKIVTGTISTSSSFFVVNTGMASVQWAIANSRQGTVVWFSSSSGGNVTFQKANTLPDTIDWVAVGTV